MPRLPDTHSHQVHAPRHINEQEEKKKVYDRQKRRALPTNSSRWRKIRAMILRRDPVCKECLKNHKIVPATEVDHINNDASTLESNNPDNLQGLCRSCHNSKTAKELNKTMKHKTK